jgi:hypothetical protein
MAVSSPAIMETRVPVPLHQYEQPATRQSVGAPNVISQPPDNSKLGEAAGV